MLQKDEKVDLLAKFNKVKNQGYSAILLRVQYQTYSMISRLIDQNKNYQNVTYLLKIAEFLQLLNLVLNSTLAHMWQSSVLSYLMIVCQYLNWSKIESDTQDVVLITIFVFNCLVLSFWIILLGLFLFTTKDLQTLRSVLLAILAGYSVLFNSLLILPMAEITFSVNFCVSSDIDSSFCQDRPWTVARTLAILNTFLIFFKCLLFELQQVDLNPLTNSVFASFFHKHFLLGQLKKLLLSALFYSIGEVKFCHSVVLYRLPYTDLFGVLRHVHSQREKPCYSQLDYRYRKHCDRLDIVRSIDHNLHGSCLPQPPKHRKPQSNLHVDHGYLPGVSIFLS